MTSEDIKWLREYTFSAAMYADQNTCVGAREHDAAVRKLERAVKLFDELEHAHADTRDVPAVE